MAIMPLIIWIDENIDNEENIIYFKELESIGLLNVRLFKQIDKAINHMKYIEFQETKVIISGRLYYEFVKKFKENIIDMCVAPKIIIFTIIKKNLLNIIENIKIILIYFINLEELRIHLMKLKNF